MRKKPHRTEPRGGGEHGLFKQTNGSSPRWRGVRTVAHADHRLFVYPLAKKLFDCLAN
jgi:hypothetical protein